MLTKRKLIWIICFLCIFMSLMACRKEQKADNIITKQPEPTATPALTLEPTKEVMPTSTLEPTPTLEPTSTVCGATEGAAKGHSWKAATCTEAKKCTVCGATEGAAKGHNWQAATCTEAKKCTACGVTEGAAKGHSWQAATCTEAKKCTVCEATEGSAAGHSITDNGEKRYCTKCGYVTAVASWGEWSDWGTEPVSETANRQVETRIEDVTVSSTEYRYQRVLWYNADGVLSSGKMPKSGYTQGTPEKDNKQYCYDYTDWMPESQRVTGVPKPAWNNINVYTVNGTSYYVEESRTVSDTVSQTQYRYRDKGDSATQPEPTTGGTTPAVTQAECEITGHSVTDDGTKQYCSRCGYVIAVASWGEWSDWSTTAVSATDNRQVETRAENVSVQETEYRYQRVIWYREDSTLHSTQKPPLSEGYTQGTPKPGNKEYAYDYTDWMPESKRVTGVPATYGIDVYKVNGETYYVEESRTVSNTVPQTQYRYRDKVYQAD